jgi:hypothetical protein
MSELKPLQQVRAIGNTLAMFESSRGVCPFCGGGSDKEETFSVRRLQEAIGYVCYRAKCGVKGMLDVGATIDKPLTFTAPKVNVIDKMHFGQLDDKAKDILKQKFYLTDEEMRGWMHVTSHGRVAIPIYSAKRKVIGYVAKSFDRKVTPKNITALNDANEPLASFYLHDNDKHGIWIVEDQISAIRANKYVNSCALLGSHMQESLVMCLKNNGFKHITLALDKDAFAKSLIYQKKFNAMFNSFKVCKLEKDIKNMSPSDLDVLMLRSEMFGDGLS